MIIRTNETARWKNAEAAVRTGIAALLVLGAGAMGAPEAVSRRRPNIVVIVADDLGYGDLGCHGCKDIPTPNIDSLARNGVRFSNGYVSCPVCSPTRAGLMTGRYQQRFGHEFNPGPVKENVPPDIGLPTTEVTLANALKSAGYVTGLVGKWHLGLAPKFHPMERGFDEFFGFLHGSHSYVDARGDKVNLILRGREAVDEKEYLTDAFTREATAFIDRHRDRPFFLYLAYNAVHTPMQAPAKYLDRFPKIEETKRRTYAAMLSAMDDGIGAVLGRIREAKLEENTLFFFLSDNGGPPEANASNNAPLRGAKGTVLEGGVRVPFVMQWKGRLPVGKVYERPVISLDVFPTAVAAADGKVPEDRVTDGVNLLPFVLDEKSGVPHETLFWRAGANRAVRKGDWKLVKQENDEHRLYNLAEDFGEDHDLAGQKLQVVEELKKDYAAWDRQLEKPRWARPRSATQPAKRARERRQR